MLLKKTYCTQDTTQLNLAAITMAAGIITILIILGMKAQDIT
jgi:hypothetical protein